MSNLVPFAQRSRWSGFLTPLCSLPCLALLGGLLSPAAQAQTDTTPPTATLSAPTTNARLADLSAGISGTATDTGTGATGVASMTVRLSRSWPNVATTYWNGTSWQSATANLTVALGTVNGSGTKSWNVTSALPSGSDFATGRYNLLVQAKDGANLLSTATNSLFYSGTDTVAPQVTLTSPTSGSTYAPADVPTALSGTVKDPLNSDGSAGSGITSVTIKFVRTFNGVTEIWNPATSSWSTSSTVGTNFATVAAPDANGLSTWSATVSVPPAASLPPAIYQYQIQGWDRSNLAGTISPTVRVIPVDTTLPQLSVTTPAANATITTSSVPWTGTTWDPDAPDSTPGSGVSQVQASLYRRWGTANEYWNGSAWVSTQFYFNATVGTPDANDVSAWSVSPTLPASFPAGNYSIAFVARDRYSNAYSLVVPVSVGPADSTAPTVSITTPASSTVLTAGSSLSLGAITGTAQDENNGSGMARVRLQIARTRLGATEYWSGTAWGTNPGYGFTLAASSPTGAFNWSQSSSLPSGTNLPAGLYTISATAYDRFDNASTTVTRTLGVVQSLDALVAAGEDTTATPLASNAYVGKYIINTDGTNQVATAQGGAGAPIVFSVKVHKYNGSDDVTLTGATLDNGWSADYYANNGDITSAMTGTGWVHSMLDGEDVIITVVVTPPTSATIGSLRDVLIHAVTTGQEDVVKATATVRAVGVPDVAVKRITGMDEAQVASEVASDTGWTGLDVIGSTQSLSAVTGAGLTERYAVRIKNAGTVDDAFLLHLTSPASGWTLHLFDAAGQPVSSTAPTLLALPTLAVGASTTFTLEAQSSGGTTVGNDITVSATAGANTDAVTIHDQLQSIAKLQWSIDGATWTDIAAGGTINAAQADTIALRAVKSLSTADWPDTYPLGPEWTYNGDQFEGDDIRIHAVDLTGTGSTPVVVICGNTITINVHVGDSDAFIKYDTE